MNNEPLNIHTRSILPNTIHAQGKRIDFVMRHLGKLRFEISSLANQGFEVKSQIPLSNTEIK